MTPKAEKQSVNETTISNSSLTTSNCLLKLLLFDKELIWSSKLVMFGLLGDPYVIENQVKLIVQDSLIFPSFC